MNAKHSFNTKTQGRNNTICGNRNITPYNRSMFSTVKASQRRQLRDSIFNITKKNKTPVEEDRNELMTIKSFKFSEGERGCKDTGIYLGLSYKIGLMLLFQNNKQKAIDGIQTRPTRS